MSSVAAAPQTGKMPQPRRELADTFRHRGVARAYGCRPAYPTEAIDVLSSLIVGDPRVVLDLGAGDGSLSRPLSVRVDHVHAVEPSAAMVDAGRAMADDSRQNISWFVEPAEKFSCAGPVGLAVAGASMHWFDLPVVCRRLATVMAPGAQLAVCDRSATCAGLEELAPVIRRYSRSPDYDPSYSVIDDLQGRGLWHQTGHHATGPVVFRQAVDDFVESLHSTASLARELMELGEYRSFDAEVCDILMPLADGDHQLRLSLTSTIAWGPLAMAPSSRESSPDGSTR